MLRRALLKAPLLVAGLADPSAASAPRQTDAVTAADVQRVAAIEFGASLSAEDAEQVAAAASRALANLKYLELLRSDDVQTPFDYPSVIAEASRDLAP